LINTVLMGPTVNSSTPFEPSAEEAALARLLRHLPNGTGLDDYR